MGLDIFIYRLSKPEMEDRTYLKSEIDALDLCSVPAYRAEEEMEIFQEALPYTIQRMVTTEYINVEKIIADYNLPKDAYVGMMCASSISVGGTDENGNYISQDITRQEIDEAYTVAKTELSYVWAQEEVAYWRKAFEVQDFFYNILSNRVVNTGYHLLHGADIGKFITRFESTSNARPLTKEEPQADSALFYHEWY